MFEKWISILPVGIGHQIRKKTDRLEAYPTEKLDSLQRAPANQIECHWALAARGSFLEDGRVV